MRVQCLSAWKENNNILILHSNMMNMCSHYLAVYVDRQQLESQVAVH